MSVTTRQEALTEIRNDLSAIEEMVVTGVHLADLIRIGSAHTTQAVGWGNESTACAMSAAALGAVAMGVLPE